MKKVLITGANSYIGTSFENYIKENHPDEFQIDTLDMQDLHWKDYDFSGYDSVFHVAGIAHSDVGKVSEERKQQYYKVNTDLVIETATKAKKSGVRQFINMSSIIVYGESAPIGKKKIITRETKPIPSNFYGDSKLQADLKLMPMNDKNFKVCIIRPPMIYGPGCKGNYQVLAKLAKTLPVFPNIKNERSMLFVGNLCVFIKQCIGEQIEGIQFPQNDEYVCTSQLVKEIARLHGRKIHLTHFFNPFIFFISKFSGRIGTLCNKAFGNIIYSQRTFILDRFESINKTIEITENKLITNFSHDKRRILLIALPGYSAGIRDKMISLGYDVLHINDKPNNGVVCKTLGRLKIPLYEKIIDKYYTNILNPYISVDFNYIVSIRGEYTPKSTLQYLASNFPNAKKILYMWDSVINNKGIEQKWQLYDKVFTFDRIDYLNFKDRIAFLPLYYYEDYLPKSDKLNSYKYDIAFIGTGHGDRVKIVNQVKKQCLEYGIEFYSYIYLPHYLIYLKNKLFNSNYRNVKIKDINFKMMPFENAYNIYSQSKCVMDIESITQNGLTMRTIEVLGLKKKLITTNRDIIYYDIFNENNVMLLNREDFMIDTNFIEKSHVELDNNIYQKYTLENWINVLLGDDKK